MKAKIFFSENFETLRPELIRLGFQFYGEMTDKSVDPEKMILCVSALIFNEPKAYKILITWLIELTSVINVERLKSLYELQTEIGLPQSIGLYILTGRLIESGDKRYSPLHQLLLSKLKQRQKELAELMSEFNDSYLIEKHGPDPALGRLSIRSYLIEGADVKKNLTLKQVLKLNPWLQFRALVGSNYRADVLYLKTLNQFKTKYALWKALGSSQETAYRLCNELDSVPELRLKVAWS